MNKLRKLGCAAALVVALLPVRGVETDPAQDDYAGLVGHWAMVGGFRDGQALPAESLKDSRRECTGNEVKVVVAGQLMMKARFKLDVTTQPRSIDYDITAGPNRGRVQLGIYELAGDTVKFCFAQPGRKRPTGFTTKAGDGWISSVWKRESK